MNDYISREAVLTCLCNRHCATDPAECLFKITHNGDPGCFTADHILQIPAANVRPVKRGEWIPETDRHYHWHCSECGYVIGAIRMDADFCLKCGADMTGGADG